MSGETKRCPRCEAVKKKEAFSKNRANHDGLASWCKVCRREAAQATMPRGEGKRHSDEEKQRAREMRANGLSYAQIAQEFGASPTTVRRWCHPEEEERKREYNRLYYAQHRDEARSKRHRRWKREKEQFRQARQALARERQAREMAARKDGVGEAYVALRRTAQILDHELDNGISPEAKGKLDVALALVYRAEDAVIKASRVG